MKRLWIPHAFWQVGIQKLLHIGVLQNAEKGGLSAPVLRSAVKRLAETASDHSCAMLVARLSLINEM